MKSLKDTLLYKNERVVLRFCSKYNVEFDEANDILYETIKWLWLCAKNQDQCVVLNIYKPMLIIDEMWHNFILFTKDYWSFCHNYLGRYIHHVPDVGEAKANKGNPPNREDKLEERKRMMAYIYDHLGRETLIKWFETFGDKYAVGKLNEIRLDYY